MQAGLNMMNGNTKSLNFTTKFLLLILLFTFSFVLDAKESTYNHDKTGFELTGPHERLSCDSCHIRGVFKGIPKQCEGCHDSGSQIGSSIKPNNHIQTSGSCEGCHAGNTWVVTGFNHDSITGSCISCHNGTTATGKTTNHVQSTNTCDDCHSQISWIPARFDHLAITGSCVSCHNGITATGKSPNHISSSDTCDNCHVTVTWSTNRVDHNDVVGGSCFTCHNGTTATGKPSNHISSGTVCDDCHSTSAWIPANFDHDTITGSCTNCHNGVTAVGPSTGHFITSLPCETCHTTISFIPDIYNHASTDFPNHPSDPTCIKCHAGNNSTVTWNTTYSPNCGACHEAKFNTKPHKKVDGVSNYTISELQDCTNSTCHLLNPDLTIKQTYNPRHFLSGW